MVQNRFQPYMVVSQPSWIGRSWIRWSQQKVMGFKFEVQTHKIWSQYLNLVPTYGPKSVSTIYGGQSAILNWTTLTKSHWFIFGGTNMQTLKSISLWSQYLQYRVMAQNRSVGHLETDSTGYWTVMGLHMTLTIRSRSNLASPMDSSDVVSYWCSIHFICLSCSNKALQATEMWWDCIWPWPLGQGQIWQHQWMPQMWFPIDVQYILYV